MSLNRFLGQPKVAQGFARGDAHLALHEIYVGDLFRDGVLYLNARVHFNKDVLASVRPDGVDQEFYGSGILITDCLRKGNGITIESLAKLFIN